MLDLLLFLSQQPISEIPPGQQYDPKEAYYGTIPSTMLESFVEDVKTQVENSIDLVFTFSFLTF